MQSSEQEDSASVSLIGAVRTRAQLGRSLFAKRRKMSRRANLIGICGVCSVCILLLIATTQHRPLLGSQSTSSGRVGAGDVGTGGSNAGENAGFMFGSGSFYELDQRHAQQQQQQLQQQQQQQQQQRHFHSMNSAFSPQQTMIVYNLTASIADVLAAQRVKIATEMENFEYPGGRFGVDAEKLSDMTLDKGGVPVRSIVVTTWRSGSTFLGDILNAMPGNFYHYEPLLDFGIKQVRDHSDIERAVRNLKYLLNCDYTDLEDYLEYGKSHTYLFEHNERLWSICKEFPHFCWQAKFLSPLCKLFPMQSMKTVRLRLATAEHLLADKSLNIRVVLLVRDPRGTMQSRKHRVWCGGNPDCDDPHYLCNDLVDDYYSAERLLAKYPLRFRTLRYEDLSLNPYDMAQEILQFYGLPFDPMVEEFLDTHTKVNIGGVSSTYRDSRSAPFHWKQDLKIEEIKFIQNACTKAMDLWGYRKIANFTEFQRTFDPIILPPPLA